MFLDCGTHHNNHRKPSGTLGERGNSTGTLTGSQTGDFPTLWRQHQPLTAVWLQHRLIHCDLFARMTVPTHQGKVSLVWNASVTSIYYFEGGRLYAEVHRARYPSSDSSARRHWSHESFIKRFPLTDLLLNPFYHKFEFIYTFWKTQTFKSRCDTNVAPSVKISPTKCWLWKLFISKNKKLSDEWIPQRLSQNGFGNVKHIKNPQHCTRQSFSCWGPN